MYLCYIDESGTSDIPGNTSHFVLAGLAIPIGCWKRCERDINRIKKKYDIEETEIHSGWIIRSYIEQNRIPGFVSMSYSDRRHQVLTLRKEHILQLQKSSNKKAYHQTKKTYAKTLPFIHLTYAERLTLAEDIAETIGSWQFARLFAECVDKVYFDPSRSPQNLDEQAFEQVVSRFENFLRITKQNSTRPGLLIHDNNETVAKKHTKLMKSFHRRGTFWTKIENIIETPLFVSSELTSMIQTADLCAYAIRRYLENNQTALFDKIFQRADRRLNCTVGVRHFTKVSCVCTICATHKAPVTPVI